MRIARLGSDDAPAYRRLMLHAYEQDADAFTSTAEERAAEADDWWAHRIADPRGLSAVFGAFNGDRLVGSAAIEFSAKSKTGHKAHVVGMFVASDCRGRGAGKALLQAVDTCARSRAGVAVLTLTVTEGNDAATALYVGAGFMAFGVEPLAVLTPSGFKAKIHMWKRLD